MIDIQKIVKTNFSVVSSKPSIGSYKKVLFVYDKSSSSALANAKKIYETLGGNVEDVIEVSVTTSDTSENIKSAVLDAKKAVSGTDNDFIFVCISRTLNSSIEDIVQAVSLFVAPYKIIPCVTLSELEVQNANLSNYPVAIKLGNGSEEAAMSIPAYFSSINLNKDSSLKDYCYTPEVEIQDTYTKYDVSDIVYETAVQKYNFLNQVGKSVVNFGGNLANGVSITAQFGAIAVENDIIKAVLDTLLKKQYLNNAGLNNIIGAINSVMTRYTYNGFLEQNGVYTGETYEESYNNKTYTLIKKGVILPEGYYVARIPMSHLKMEDRKARQFTPIRIFMQTLAGARTVELNGVIVD